MRILLVDDDANVRSVVAEMLEMDGHTVLQAASGQESLERLEAEVLVDLVITDLGMPAMNGWDVARAVKKLRPFVPVGVITGWGENVAAGGSPGPADFVIGKPITEEGLRAAVSRAHLVPPRF